MTHWLIAPVVLPAMLAPFIVLAARYHIGIQRVFSIVGVLTLMGTARARRVDHGRQACGEVVATVKYTVDLGMGLEKRFNTPDDG